MREIYVKENHAEVGDIFVFIEVESEFIELYIFRQTWHGFPWYFPEDIDHGQLKEYAYHF